jgi:hypothetical protein
MSEIFIDWSKAPEGTTHAWKLSASWKDGIPGALKFWEKHTEDNIYEWSDIGWQIMPTFSDRDLENRIARPDAPFQNAKHLSVELDHTNVPVSGEPLIVMPYPLNRGMDSLYSYLTQTRCQIESALGVPSTLLKAGRFERADFSKYAQPDLGREINAADFLKAGLKHMDDRASTYDKPTGERSMAKTVAMFNIATDLNLTEEQGWLFMGILKKVRSTQGNFKADNYEDEAAYAALRGECAVRDRTIQPAPAAPTAPAVSDDELKEKLSKLSADFGRDTVLQVFKPFNMVVFTADVHKLSDYQRISMYLECDRIRKIKQAEKKS